MPGGRRETDHTYYREMLDEKLGNFDEKLDKILDQTTQHNHRMSKIEARIWMIVGGLIVIGFIVVPLFFDVLKN